MAAGGDWETPCFFILYLDQSRLRAYIPEDGNNWNNKTKQAYGNDDEKDKENILSRYGLELDSMSSFEHVINSEELIKQDIIKRIKPYV